MSIEYIIAVATTAPPVKRKQSQQPQQHTQTTQSTRSIKQRIHTSVTWSPRKETALDIKHTHATRQVVS